MDEHDNDFERVKEMLCHNDRLAIFDPVWTGVCAAAEESNWRMGYHLGRIKINKQDTTKLCSNSARVVSRILCIRNMQVLFDGHESFYCGDRSQSIVGFVEEGIVICEP